MNIAQLFTIMIYAIILYGSPSFVQTETSSTATSTAPAANLTTSSATTTSGAAGGRVGVGGAVSGVTNAPTPAKPTWKRRPTRATDEVSLQFG